MMPPENNRNMEEWLKACADQRRREQGAPFELHPATREMLLAEAARTCPVESISATTGNRLWFERWWPRLAWGSAIFACSVVIMLVLRAPNPPIPQVGSMDARSDQRLALAKQETVDRSPAKVEDERPLPPPAAAPAKESVSATNAKDYAMTKPPASMAPMAAPAARPVPRESETMQMRRYGLAAPAPAPASTPAPLNTAPARAMPSGASRREKAAVTLATPSTDGARLTGLKASATKGSVETSPSNQPAAPGTATPQDRFDLAAIESKAKKSNDQGTNNAPRQIDNTRLRFSNVDVRSRYRRNFNSPAELPVLNSFELEQTGSQIRIVDADGSVYEGRIAPAEAPKDLAENRRAVSASGVLTQAPAVQPAAAANAGMGQTIDNDASAASYNFRAVGTNRTLNQRVVFSGNYMNTASAPSQAANNIGNRTVPSVANNQAAAKAQLQSNQLPIGGGAQIQGQAFIGTNNQVEINALEHPLP